MDQVKCTKLKAELSEANVPLVVPIVRFFDGNDDSASIGCNLVEHPGIEVFRELLTGLLRRSDVLAVYAQIAELDPGEGSWPFTDTVVVIGSVSKDQLRKTLSVLQPTEIGTDRSFNFLATDNDSCSLAVWWD